MSTFSLFLRRYFNPRSLTGATIILGSVATLDIISIHAPSRERPGLPSPANKHFTISIHAPSRERLYKFIRERRQRSISIHAPSRERRPYAAKLPCGVVISIHAPSRERPALMVEGLRVHLISIHAPSRERHRALIGCGHAVRFQSTLPHGSDLAAAPIATHKAISIHAPSRERRISAFLMTAYHDFNPRSLTGATRSNPVWYSIYKHFNPRSLTGATLVMILWIKAFLFQSTLPHGSDERPRSL